MDLRRYWGLERGKAATRLWGVVALLTVAAVVCVAAVVDLPGWVAFVAGLAVAVLAQCAVACVIEAKRRTAT